MRRTALLLIGLTLLATRPAVTAREDDVPEASVIGILSVDIAAIWDADIFKEARDTLQTKAIRFRSSLQKEIGLTPEQVARVTYVQFKVKTGENEVLLLATVVTARQPFDAAAFVTSTGMKPLLAKGKLAELPEVSIYITDETPVAINDRQVVLLERSFTHEMLIEPIDPDVKPEKPAAPVEKKLAPGDREMIVKALQPRDADRAAQMTKDRHVLNANVDVAEAVRLHAENVDANALPPYASTLMKARFLTATVSLRKSAEVSMALTFTETDTAAAAKTALETGVRQLQQLLDESFIMPMGMAKTGPLVDIAKLGASVIQNGAVRVKEKVVTFQSAAELTPAFASVLAKGVVALEDAAARTQSQNNLIQIAMSAQNFSDANAAGLLQNYHSDKGKPLLSWRVALLPYLEQNELFEQFKLDEPWDSEHNKKLIPKMPKVYMVPTAVAVKEGQTFYQAFIGKKGQAIRPLLQHGDEKGMTLQTISDGTSNTIMVAEAADAVTWTKPDDLPFDNDGKLPKLGGHFDGGFNVALCDGTVRFVKATIAEVTLKAHITANGGEVVAFDDD